MHGPKSMSCAENAGILIKETREAKIDCCDVEFLHICTSLLDGMQLSGATSFFNFEYFSIFVVDPGQFFADAAECFCIAGTGFG